MSLLRKLLAGFSRRSETWRGQNTVFLVGNRRSGTTFLGRLLGSHPQIAYWEEPDLLVWSGQLFNEIRTRLEHANVDARVNPLQAQRKGNLREQFASSVGTGPLAPREQSIAMTRQLLSELREAFLQVARRPLLLDKSPSGLGVLEWGVELLPDARFVHIVRDCRDVVCSMRFWTNRRGEPALPAEAAADFSGNAQEWATTVEQAARIAAGNPSVLQLHYESLMQQPHATINTVLQFLGLRWTREIDQFLSSGMGGIDPRSVGRWRRDLTPDQLATVHRVAGHTMERLGYHR